MKKAIGYVHKGDMFTALKIPFGLNLIGIEYPSKEGKVKIILQGDSLPVADNTKKIPEINYEVQGTWHQARITEIEPEKKTEIKSKEDQNHGKKRKYTKKSQRKPDISETAS